MFCIHRHEAVLVILHGGIYGTVQSIGICLLILVFKFAIVWLYMLAACCCQSVPRYGTLLGDLVVALSPFLRSVAERCMPGCSSDAE